MPVYTIKPSRLKRIGWETRSGATPFKEFLFKEEQYVITIKVSGFPKCRPISIRYYDVSKNIKGNMLIYTDYRNYRRIDKNIPLNVKEVLHIIFPNLFDEIKI